MQKGTISEVFDEFAEDLLGESSVRPLVIVGASKVDDLLLRTLTGFLLPKTAKAKDSDELLEGDRPLATFSARIKICYRLGLIDPSLFLCLEHLRSLRNKCAHSVEFDPAKSPVRELLSTFFTSVKNRKSYQLTQQRFFPSAPTGALSETQCSLLTICVVLQSINNSVRQTKGNKTALRIASS